MPHYEVKSGKTLFFVEAKDRQDAVDRFVNSCGLKKVDSITYVNNSTNVLDGVIDRLEYERSLYFDYHNPEEDK
jgi:hypothetical protein